MDDCFKVLPAFVDLLPGVKVELVSVVDLFDSLRNIVDCSVMLTVLLVE